MSKSSAVRLVDHRALIQLVGDCRELGDENRLWQLHFLGELSRLISADVCVGGELKGLASGAPRPVTPGDTPIEFGFERGFNIQGWHRALELLQTDPTYSPVLKSYAQHDRQQGLALRRTDLVRTADWESSTEFGEVYLVAGIDHNIGCFQAIPGVVDEVYGSYLLRAKGRPDFTPRDRMIVQLAFASIKPMVGHQLARSAEPSPSDLSPRVRQVLQCVLEGDGDKQIATRMQISKYTVNQYLKVIYKHFHVSSRAELQARWIRRGWGARFAWNNT
jgi:DNA-binding CsgD family transcriptional regulator